MIGVVKSYKIANQSISSLPITPSQQNDLMEHNRKCEMILCNSTGAAINVTLWSNDYIPRPNANGTPEILLLQRVKVIQDNEPRINDGDETLRALSIISTPIVKVV